MDGYICKLASMEEICWEIRKCIPDRINPGTSVS